MVWIKKGLIFNPNYNYPWMISHATLPFDLKLDDKKIRIYFSSRDKNNCSHTGFIETELNDNHNSIIFYQNPVLSPGKLGSFDESGAMGSNIVKINNELYLYYIGWNLGKSVAYRNSIGVAKSIDQGITFHKLYEGPIIDRSIFDPIFVAAPYVLYDKKIWKMWYVSAIEWKTPNEPIYNIKYAESLDGINWNRNHNVSINFNSPDETKISRPWVIYENNIYHMWYSFELNKITKIGYAESIDGLKWIRKDKDVMIDTSNSGWDSEMIANPCVVNIHNKKIMLYNGNNFGKSGIGYAIWE